MAQRRGGPGKMSERYCPQARLHGHDIRNHAGKKSLWVASLSEKVCYDLIETLGVCKVHRVGRTDYFCHCRSW